MKAVNKEDYERFRRQFNDWVDELNERVELEAKRMGIKNEEVDRYGIKKLPGYDYLVEKDRVINDPTIEKYYDFERGDWVRKTQDFKQTIPSVNIALELAKEQMLTFDLRTQERMYGILLYFEELGDSELLEWGLKASYEQLEALIKRDVIPSYIAYKQSFKPDRDDIDVYSEAERIKEAIGI